MWYTVSSPNVTDGSPASPLAVLSLRKDTYDFRVYARLKNGKTGMLNYFTGGNTATVAMPVTASDKDDYEFPFFLGSSLDVSLADKGGGNYLMIWQPAFDNIGVVKYKVEITGTDVNISKDIDVPYINVDLTKSSNYTLKLTAYDEAGNSSVSVPKSITAP